MNFNITFTPQRRDDALEIKKSGNNLIINGESFGFTKMKPGYVLPGEAISSGWIVGDVTCDENGSLHLTVIYPSGDGGEVITRTVTDDGAISYE